MNVLDLFSGTPERIAPRLLLGDCRDVLKTLADASVDSVVTDPPYELGFMGKAWDGSGIAYDVGMWREVLRVLKRGGHLLAFGGDRTHHRLACAIEDAGFEIRTTITWLFGSGFPKSLNVSKKLRDSLPADAQCVCALHLKQTAPDSPVDYPECHGSYGERHKYAEDTAAGVSPSPDDAHEHSHDDLLVDGQEVLRANTCLDEGSDRHATCCLPHQSSASGHCQFVDSTQSDKASSKSNAQLTVEHKTATDTRCKPRSAFDLASSSSSEVYANLPRCPKCNKYEIREGMGTALKPAAEYIVMARKPLIGTVAENVLAFGTGAINVDGCRVGFEGGCAGAGAGAGARVFGDGLNGTFAQPVPGLGRWPANLIHDGSAEVLAGFPETTSNDTGSAARFFYTAKADATDRDQGLEGFLAEFAPTMGNGIGGKEHDPETATPKRNVHPTVKPTELMRYLCRLVTPPGGIVLDPFMGSGSTGKAAALERFDFIGIERDPDYLEIARARIAWLGVAPSITGGTEQPRTESVRGSQLALSFA